LIWKTGKEVPVLAPWDIRSKKCVVNDALRFFSAPSLYLADGDFVAHIAVYFSVLERIF
jgi:hypothetical protein